MATPDYNFISEPDPNLKCFICLGLASQPKQCEDCGKLFCSECIDKERKKPCPHCKVNNPKYFRDVKSNGEVKAITVRCFSMRRGCPWTGTIEALDTHLASCGFTLVPCPNKCVDDEDVGEMQIIRKDLEDHLKIKCPRRPFECPHCGEKGTYVSITGDHDKVCDKKMVACPNKGSGCLLSMERGKTKQHVTSECEYTEVACTYESFGCEERMLRKDIEKHEAEIITLHLKLMLGIIESQLEQRKTLSEQYNTLSEKHEILSDQQQLLFVQHKKQSEGESLVFKLPKYTSKKDKQETFCSTPFYTHPGGYNMCIRIDAANGEGTHVAAYTKLLKGPYDDQLHWPFLATIKYELLNQLADDRHYRRVLTYDTTYNMQVGSVSGYPKFVPHSSLRHNPATNTQYLLDDTLYFRVSVKMDNLKPWLVCNDKINMDSITTIEKNKPLKRGKHYVFKLSEYSLYKDEGTYYCDSFYSSPGGYKMNIMTHPNGYSSGKGTHLSVFATLLEGSYDASLLWPFRGTVTFTLLNQLSDENHHSMMLEYTATPEYGNVGNKCGHIKFISHSALPHDPVRNTQYLKNDTLYFRVSVEDHIHKPAWLACT